MITLSTVSINYFYPRENTSYDFTRSTPTYYATIYFLYPRPESFEFNSDDDRSSLIVSVPSGVSLQLINCPNQHGLQWQLRSRVFYPFVLIT